MPSSFTKAEFHFEPPVIGHRGARAVAPENTLASFRRAADDGALWIEGDVKLTYDGVPVMMHDDTLDRTTSGRGLVAEMKWAEMQSLDAGSWFGPAYAHEPIPHLAEIVRFVIARKLRFNLELKPCPGRVRATVMVALIEVAKIWPEDYPPPLISSFDVEALTIAANLHPGYPRGLLFDEWREDWVEMVRATGASTIHLNDEILTVNRVAMLAETGRPILAFTVNNPQRAKDLLHWGASAVFSDDPKAIIKAL